MGQYDHAMKSIVDADPQAIAQLVVHLARTQGIFILKGDIKSVTRLNSEFQGVEATADGLLLIETVDGRRFIIHIEFQSTRDKYMPDRLLDYCLRTRRKYGPLPILCCVIYLRDDGNIEEPPWIWPWFEDQVAMIFQYVCIKLWETPREEIEVSQQPALWPLALLAKGAIDDILVRKMFENLLANKLHDLIPVGQTVAAWLLKGASLERLKKEYYRMLELFEDSPFYEWVAEREAEKVRQQIEEFQHQTLSRFRETVVALVVHEFPDLAPLAQQQVALLKSQERLQQLILQVGTAHDRAGVARALVDVQADEQDEDAEADR